MRYLLPLLGCLLAANAYADRIPDYSLPPEETVQQPNSVHYDTQPLNPNGPSNGTVGTSRNPYTKSGALAQAITPTAHFMDGYCDQNFSPAIEKDSHYATIAACLHQQREQACSQFQQLPDDAKKVLDKTIDCTNKLLNGENPDDQATADTQTNCSNTDGLRLQLVKKYWRDPNTAYALLFLPDEIMDNSSKCLRGGL